MDPEFHSAVQRGAVYIIAISVFVPTALLGLALTLLR